MPLRYVKGAAQALCISVSLAAAACRSFQPSLVLDTSGGDAWTFSKSIGGDTGGHCRAVDLIAPAGTFPAAIDGTHFAATLDLVEGDNEVQAVCRDGTAGTATQRWHVRLPARPKAWTRVVVIGGNLVVDGGRTEPAPSRPRPIVSYRWRDEPLNPAPVVGLPADGKRITLRAPARDGEYQVRLEVADADGRTDESVARFRVRHGVPEPIDLAREHPGWIDDAVVYGIAPALLGPDGLRRVIGHLDDIAALGATVLWLSPITDSPPGDFGYAVTDYFRVRADLGSETDLRRLVAEAHRRGIHVIMDFVPNHLSDRHGYYVDTLDRGRRSPYFDFFERGPDGEVAHYFDWHNLETLNYDNPEVERFEIAAFVHWLRDAGVDGFRVDASWAVKERAPEFWDRWRAELQRVNPDLLLLAEASARDRYFARHGFDAAYDWTEKVGQWAWQDAFGDESPVGRAQIAARLRAALAATAAAAPRQLVFRFLDNNDTGSRFITRHGIGWARVAAAMLMTLPGLPGVYMGEEVGAAFEPYSTRPPIDWSDRYGLRPYYRSLIALRRAQPALRSREVAFVTTSNPGTVLAYMRPGDAPGESLLVILNYQGTALDVVLPDIAGGRFRDLLTGRAVMTARRRPAVRLGAYEAVILKRGD